jgi:hypothetical protein
MATIRRLNTSGHNSRLGCHVFGRWRTLFSTLVHRVGGALGYGKQTTNYQIGGALKSLILLWKMLANECASRCHTSATRDCKTVTRRCEHEGLSFLTITLPTFGKDLQKGLDRGYVAHDLFHGFSWAGGLPRFLGGFLERVFDRTSGTLLDEPCVDSIRSMRQLTLMFGKMLLPCTPERERRAFTGYIQCEQDVRRADALLDSDRKAEFKRISSMLYWDAFRNIDNKIYMYGLRPKHGPGKVADRLSSNGKYNLRTWTERLQETFPVEEYLLTNYSWYELLENVDILEPGSEIPVRVISVPKTLKTPRIIGVEPTVMQFAQQGLLPEILDGLSKVDYLDAMLGFKDQSPNQRMALEGALDGRLATLDLSEASDRVSNQLVRLLFSGHELLTKHVQASRSRKADVPGYGVHRLAKFASMGSALCFPIEAMVFLTVIFVGIQRSLNVPLTLSDIKSFKGSVRVYGDDIIVPVDHVLHVIDELQTFGFEVNVDKSFWTGRFRESCGKEYYGGNDVTYVKVRRMFPTRRADVSEVVSIVSLRNQLYWAGYWETVRWLDEFIIRIIKHFPYVEPTSSVLGRESVLGYEKPKRFHKHLHTPLVKGYTVSSRSPKDILDDHGALYKWHSTRGEMPSDDEDHLTRSGRAQSVDIKLGWHTPY